jgi:hypothetical protein
MFKIFSDFGRPKAQHQPAGLQQKFINFFISFDIAANFFILKFRVGCGFLLVSKSFP